MAEAESSSGDDAARLVDAREEERGRLLAELFERHRARLRSLVQLRLDLRLRGRVDPSDVLQDAYLQASLRLDGLLEPLVSNKWNAEIPETHGKSGICRSRSGLASRYSL